MARRIALGLLVFGLLWVIVYLIRDIATAQRV